MKLKLSSKTDYALRTVLDLANHRAYGVTSVGEIAERQEIPVKFLEQILLILKAGGIVLSRRGARGGYSLALPPEKITLARIVKLTENAFSPDIGGIELANIPEAPADPFADVFSEISEFIEKKLEGTTIAEIAERELYRSSSWQYHYQI